MDATQPERWRPVAGYEGLYEVSDQGRVRGVERELISANGQVRRWRGRILAHDFDRHGYPRIGLHVGGMTKRFLVHHLVLHAFVGSKPDGMEVRHLNDVRSDNRLANLVYGTRSQNMFDASATVLITAHLVIAAAAGICLILRPRGSVSTKRTVAPSATA